MKTGDVGICMCTLFILFLICVVLSLTRHSYLVTLVSYTLMNSSTILSHFIQNAFRYSHTFIKGHTASIVRLSELLQ